jgi:hypothetical protein
LWLASSFLEFLWVSSSLFSSPPYFFFSWCFLPWVFSALLVLSDIFSLFWFFVARFMLLGFVLRGFIFC